MKRLILICEGALHKIDEQLKLFSMDENHFFSLLFTLETTQLVQNSADRIKLPAAVKESNKKVSTEVMIRITKPYLPEKKMGF
jgi:hypothetical protein